jgi:hypothetical protein
MHINDVFENEVFDLLKSIRRDTRRKDNHIYTIRTPLTFELHKL